MTRSAMQVCPVQGSTELRCQALDLKGLYAQPVYIVTQGQQYKSLGKFKMLRTACIADIERSEHMLLEGLERLSHRTRQDTVAAFVLPSPLLAVKAELANVNLSHNSPNAS